MASYGQTGVCAGQRRFRGRAVGSQDGRSARSLPHELPHADYYAARMRANDGTGQRGHTAPRHVWVKYGSAISPGVLLDWRQEGSGWEALVVYASGGGTSSVTVTQQWVPAAHVEPVA